MFEIEAPVLCNTNQLLARPFDNCVAGESVERIESTVPKQLHATVKEILEDRIHVAVKEHVTVDRKHTHEQLGQCKWIEVVGQTEIDEWDCGVGKGVHKALDVCSLPAVWQKIVSQLTSLSKHAARGGNPPHPLLVLSIQKW